MVATSREPMTLPASFEFRLRFAHRLVEEMREDQDYLISGFLSRARKDAAQFSGPDFDEGIKNSFN